MGNPSFEAKRMTHAATPFVPGTSVGATTPVFEVGLIVAVGRTVYAQLAVVAVASDVGERVGYLADEPQSHQDVGRNQGAPSAIQLGGAIEVVMALIANDDIEARLDCAASKLDGVAG